MLREARRDAYPEDFDYRDNGCDLYVSCLSCPLSNCYFDDPEAYWALVRAVRNSEITTARLTGFPVVVIMEAFDVSRRTVFRALQQEAVYRSDPGRSSFVVSARSTLQRLRRGIVRKPVQLRLPLTVVAEAPIAERGAVPRLPRRKLTLVDQLPLITSALAMCA